MSDDPRDRADEPSSDSPTGHVATMLDERIDAALRRGCAPPDESVFRALATRAVAAETGSETAGAVLPLRRALQLAAAVALTVTGAILAWGVLAPRPDTLDPYAPQAHRTMAEVYAERAARAWEPDWACRDDEEFATTFRRQLGQRLVLHGLPSTVAAGGLGYSNTITPDTIFILATAGADRIIVFADRLDAEVGRDGQWELDLPPDLRLFRRTEGTLVLYELSPRATPTVLPHLVQPADAGPRSEAPRDP